MPCQTSLPFELPKRTTTHESARAARRTSGPRRRATGAAAFGSAAAGAVVTAAGSLRVVAPEEHDRGGDTRQRDQHDDGEREPARAALDEDRLVHEGLRLEVADLLEDLDVAVGVEAEVARRRCG